MRGGGIHRFESGDRRYAVDTETCFCFECDEISWDVLELYPETTVNQIYTELASRHDRVELEEVIGELEWLRATGSILPRTNPEELEKAYVVEKGLRRLSCLSSGNGETGEALRDALTFLFSRSEGQKALEFEVVVSRRIPNVAELEKFWRDAERMTQLAAKTLTISVSILDLHIQKPPAALEGHRLSVRLAAASFDSVATGVAAFSKTKQHTVPSLSKVLNAQGAEASACLVLRPGHAGFGDALEVLDKAGFRRIELDVDGPYIENPDINPGDMLRGMSAWADYYASRLKEHHYFRVDPLASLFLRIHNGTPITRADPIGTNALAVSENGGIVASPYVHGDPSFYLGSISSGEINEELLKEFEDVGSLTTAACMGCWARNLCGGGCASVHNRMSGDFRQPHAEWCDATREWIECAVSAFSQLSASGVNFTRVYQNLGREKPSLFQLARAAFRMSIGMRPLEEADGELLSQWESWNPASYFMLNERGVCIGNQYEREMDALQPRLFEHEFVLVHKDGTPFGLFKLRAEKEEGVAQAFLYMSRSEDYRADGVRKGFQTLIKEASSQQALRRLLVPAAAWEKDLCEFLKKLGFEEAGVQREAIYNRGSYEDVSVFSLDTSAL